MFDYVKRILLYFTLYVTFNSHNLSQKNIV